MSPGPAGGRERVECASVRPSFVTGRAVSPPLLDAVFLCDKLRDPICRTPLDCFAFLIQPFGRSLLKFTLWLSQPNVLDALARRLLVVWRPGGSEEPRFHAHRRRRACVSHAPRAWRPVRTRELGPRTGTLAACHWRWASAQDKRLSLLSIFRSQP